MKKLSTILLGLGLLVGSALYAGGSHSDEHSTKVESSNNHMGNHMHEGKMTNHMNTDGMPDEKIKKEENNHMGNHMHEGKMTNHMNKDGMSDEQMNMDMNMKKSK